MISVLLSATAAAQPVPLVLEGDPEVQTDGLGVTDVEIPVGLGGKPGDHLTAVFSRGDVPGDYGPDEIEGSLPAALRVHGRVDVREMTCTNPSR